MSFDFDRETAVRPLDSGRYEADVDPAWSVFRGPNGGYLAAIVLRALSASVDEAARAPRSLTVHYAAPPDERPLEIRTTVERTGRSLTSCSARLVQDDRLVGMALAAFSRPREGPEFCDVTMPAVAPAEELAATEPLPGAPPIAHRWEVRWGVGDPPGKGSTQAVAGGWIRLPERHVADPFVMAAITDAWIPPVFSRVALPIFVPTVDLTIHFRTALPPASMTADDFCLAVFRTRVAAEGFLEEDGEVWSPDGTLLVQSRQLAAILPVATP